MPEQIKGDNTRKKGQVFIQHSTKEDLVQGTVERNALGNIAARGFLAWEKQFDRRDIEGWLINDYRRIALRIAHKIHFPRPLPLPPVLHPVEDHQIQEQH